MIITKNTLRMPQWILYLEMRGIKVSDNVKTLWLKR
jgi:hypothetical protein